MPLKWIKSGEGPQVLALLDDLTGVNDEGGVTLGWDGKFDIYVDLLAGYIDFSKQVPRGKRVEITRQAVVDSKKGGSLGTATVLARAQEAQNEFLRLPLSNYVLLSTVSVKRGEYLRPVRMGGSSISFLKDRPRNFPIPVLGSLRVRDTTPRDYSYVKIRVSAREPNQAGELAFDRIDSLRAIWNLSLNGRTIQRSSSGSGGYEPVNHVVLGMVHTLHHPNGTQPERSGLWTSAKPKPVAVYDLSKHIESVKRDEAFVRSQIRRCTFGETLLGHLRQYCRALDESDLENSLLRLWAVLEKLTAPPKGTYDALVRRTSFLWEDFTEARLVLNYLRDHRNELVHAGSSPPDTERLLYQLKDYVEHTLWFLINHAHRFSSMEEVWSFWDLSPNVEELRARVRQHRRAIAFRSGSGNEEGSDDEGSDEV